MIVLYLGARGRGKTLSMVRDLKVFRDSGWRVLSNAQNVIFAEHIRNDQVLGLDKSSDLKNCVMMLDEIQIFFDSRQSGNKENKAFSNFIQQIRKRNIIILATTQFSNTVEKRFKQHVNVVAFPDFVKPFYCRVTYLDLDSVEDDNVFVTKKIPRISVLVYDARPYFGMYDTNEMII